MVMEPRPEGKQPLSSIHLRWLVVRAVWLWLLPPTTEGVDLQCLYSTAGGMRDDMQRGS